jgi:hypothetical protein
MLVRTSRVVVFLSLSLCYGLENKIFSNIF